MGVTSRARTESGRVGYGFCGAATATATHTGTARYYTRYNCMGVCVGVGDDGSECVTNMEYLHGNPTELDLEEKNLHPRRVDCTDTVLILY